MDFKRDWLESALEALAARTDPAAPRAGIHSDDD
jgi:hypothetical protein